MQTIMIITAHTVITAIMASTAIMVITAIKAITVLFITATIAIKKNYETYYRSARVQVLTSLNYFE